MEITKLGWQRMWEEDFSPGNGTRYKIVVWKRVDGYNFYGFGQSAKVWSIALRLSSCSGEFFTFREGADLTDSYVLSKVDWGLADAAAVLNYVKKKFPGSIGDLFGRFKLFDSTGKWVGTDDENERIIFTYGTAEEEDDWASEEGRPTHMRDEDWG